VWPLAARVAHQLSRFDVEAELLAQFDAQLPGVPAKMQHAEAALIRARLADTDGYAAGREPGAPHDRPLWDRQISDLVHGDTVQLGPLTICAIRTPGGIGLAVPGQASTE